MTLRTDATRLRIVAKDKRRLRAVASRQGQVLLDTDFDQQSRHLLDRVELETADIMGQPGRLVVPSSNDGFRIIPAGGPTAFDIGAGHGYLSGWRLENTTVCKLTTQPHPRTGDTLVAPAIVGIKALVRHIDPVEEPVFADIALGDAQASGRMLTDWQVFPLNVAGGGAITCADVPTRPEWIALTAPSTGTLAVIPQVAAASSDPCSLTPGGGYSRLENLLYRIEVHGGVAKPGFPTADGPRFDLHALKIKLSRRNASMMARVTGVVGNVVTVAPPALDSRTWFVNGAWAEIVSLHDDCDPRAALANERLFRVALATDDTITLQATAAQITATSVATDGRWFLRLWDAFPNGDGVAVVAASGGSATSAEIDLGDGLHVQLGGGATGTLRRGDYWTVAARADGSIDWPTTGGIADQMRPHGPEIRYAPLAVASGASTAPSVIDCRIPSATLTDRALLYRGGDGQSVFAPGGGAGMAMLPAKLRVAVMRGERPVAGATVRWSFVGPTGRASLIDGAPCNAATPRDATTGPDGLAEVSWAIDSAAPLDTHRVQVALVAGPTTTSVPPLIFTATFETAAHTGYTPGNCKHLTGVDNVQDALDTLCAKIGDPAPKALTLTSILLVENKGAKIELIREALILNALDVPFTSFTAGIDFGIDGGMPNIAVAPFDPVVEVEIDLPYPTTDPDKLYWAIASENGNNPGIVAPFGFQRMRLEGEVKVVPKGRNGDPGLIWMPSPDAVRFLETVPSHMWGQRVLGVNAAELKRVGWRPDRVQRNLCRIRLRSAMIWIDDKKDGDRIYLNAEHLGVVGPVTGRELSQKDRDPQRAGDLDIFVYLTPKGFKSEEKFPLKRPTDR